MAALEGRAIDVNITATTFAKVANYFVALQVNKKGKKVRTEVSAGTEKPKFKKNAHRLDLEEELTPDTGAVLTLGAFVVLPNKSGGKGNARLLGSVAYNIGDAAVRLLRGSTVPEDLTFVRKSGPDKEVVVGKISVAISLVGVGDAVIATNVDPRTRVFDITIHGAQNLSARLAPPDAEGASTMVEARVITAAHAKLIADYEKASLGGVGDSTPEAKQALGLLTNAVPARVAETRAKSNSSNPTWNEVMSIESGDSDIKDGAVLRLDVMQSPVANEGAGGTKWPSLGGVSLPLVDIEPGHQYDLCVEIDPGSGSNTSRLGLSVSGRASSDSEAATLKVNSQIRRLEILLKEMESPMPFAITSMIASVQVLSSKGLEVIEASIKSGFSSGFPSLPIGTLALKDGAGSGADLEPLAKNHEDYTILRTLEKLTPALTPGSKVGARFDHSLLFDMGNNYGVDTYPEQDEPRAIFISFFRKDLLPFDTASTGFKIPPEGAVIPSCFMGYSLIELPGDHPEDGSPQGHKDVKVVLLSPGGAMPGEHTLGPTMRIVTRMWSGQTFLRYMKDGDPIGDASKGLNALKWLSAASRLSDPNDLSGIAKMIQDKKDVRANGVIDGESKDGEEGKVREPDDPFAELDAARKRRMEQKKKADDQAKMEKAKKKAEKEKKRKEAEKKQKEDEEKREQMESKKDEDAAEKSMAAESEMLSLKGGNLDGTASTVLGGGGSLGLGQTASQGEVDELHKRLAVLTEDISHKQTLIDRLLKEVDKRSDAIRTCGVEIVQLRRKNKKLQNEKEKLDKQMKDMMVAEQREAKAISDAAAADLDTAAHGGKIDAKEVAQKLHVMSEKYKTERERNGVIMQKLKTLYQQSAKVRHSQQHFAKLEKAHQAQAAYIQKLQSENQKIEVYKATIRTQERVVAKLEELIETKLRDRKDGGTTTTFRLKQEITRLQRRNQELEKKVFAGGAGGSLAVERVKELEQELKAARMRGLQVTGPGDQPPPPSGAPPPGAPPGVGEGSAAALPKSGADAGKDAKIKALEEQMVANAKGFAAQISDLKLKLMQAEMGGGSDDDDDSDGGGSDSD